MVHNATKGSDNYYNSSSNDLTDLTRFNITNANDTKSDDTRGSNSRANIGRVVIINFDDSYKSQYILAKPILDKYGFKATFFAVCDWIGAVATIIATRRCSIDSFPLSVVRINSIIMGQ